MHTSREVSIRPDLHLGVLYLDVRSILAAPVVLVLAPWARGVRRNSFSIPLGRGARRLRRGESVAERIVVTIDLDVQDCMRRQDRGPSTIGRAPTSGIPKPMPPRSSLWCCSARRARCPTPRWPQHPRSPEVSVQLELDAAVGAVTGGESMLASVLWPERSWRSLGQVHGWR